VLTADHGESQGEEGIFFSHGTGTTPAVARVPLIVVAPGLTPGRSRDLVHHVDVLPTILDLAGVAPRPDAKGVSLARLAAAGTPPPERALFTDVGTEVSGYEGDRIERAHVQGDGSTAHSSFRWRPDGRWEPAAADAGLRARVDAYAARKAREQVADAPSADEIARLRALGYVVIEEDEAAPKAR